MRAGIAFFALGLVLAAAAIGHAEPPGSEMEPAWAPAIDPAQIDAIPLGPSPEERIEEIRRRVQEAVVYPSKARRRGIQGTTRIQFQVDAEGRATGVSTVESSGSALLDAAAERGARDATPLPYVFGRLRIPIVFELTSLGRAD